jgi:radical SAM-linked protein
MQLAEQGIRNSGFDELALLSLSSGDFSCLPELLTGLMDRFANEYVSVSMPSMRVGTLTPEIINQIKRVRKTGFTVAPEAGTDRLREVINKGITEQDLLTTCGDAFAAGWNLIKFYFMIGLPTETMEDVDGIVDLAVRARKEARGGRARINVSVATFVPKPHTPFQWAGQLSLEESRDRINRLKKKLPRKGFKLKWHDPDQSLLEGVFSRGDRRLSFLLETAWRAGARLDGWSEHYSLERWQQAAAEIDLDLDWYLRARDMDELLPWDHLSSRVDRDFLVQEYEKSVARAYTPDCRNHGCQKCGLCDFTTLRPRVNAKDEHDPVATIRGNDCPVNDREKQRAVFSYRVHYSRLDDARFLGHLEILQLVFRALHRAGLPILFSQGYNPSPRVSFSQALPVGVESHVEFFDMDLSEPLTRPDEVMAVLDQQFPDYISLTSIASRCKQKPVTTVVRYTILLPESADEEKVSAALAAFLADKSFIIERIRKKKTRELDLRPLVNRLEREGGRLGLELVHPHDAAGTNPREILEKVLGLTAEQALLARIIKNGLQERAANS